MKNIIPLIFTLILGMTHLHADQKPDAHDESQKTFTFINETQQELQVLCMFKNCPDKNKESIVIPAKDQKSITSSCCLTYFYIREKKTFNPFKNFYKIFFGPRIVLDVTICEDKTFYIKYDEQTNKLIVKW